MKEGSKQTHLCYNIFAHLKDFGQWDHNGLLYFVTLWVKRKDLVVIAKLIRNQSVMKLRHLKL